MRKNIRKLSFSMLMVCEALFRAGNTEQAANLLCISQPAVSQNLRQLRELTGDALFVRTTGGLKPTALGKKIAKQAMEVLDKSEEILHLKDQVFSPESDKMVFSVGTPSSLSRAVSAGVSKMAGGKYPRVAWHLYTIGLPEALSLLDDLKIDLFVGEPSSNLPKNYSLKVIGTVGFKILCSQKSRLATKEKVGRETFLSYPHLRVATSGYADTLWDRLLKNNKLPRNVALSLSDYPTAFAAAETLDYLFVVDEDVFRLYGGGYDLHELQATFKMPVSSNALIWDARSTNDPAHIWLRDQVVGMLNHEPAPA